MSNQPSEESHTGMPTQPILSVPQEELIIDATREGMLRELPEQVARKHREYLGIFGSPGLRALTYVLVDGEPWEKTFEARDYVTFQNPGATGRVDIRPFGQPCAASWRPDAGETDESVTLDLHQYHADRDDEFLAVVGEGEDYDTDELPHLVLGWAEVPQAECDSND